MLQQQLEEIRNNNYVINDALNIDSLSSIMLEHIGDTDGYLRDKLIYSTFYHLIKKDYISHTHLQKLLLESISDKYLLYKIHSDDEDAVFTRAFTTLLIALIIDADTNHNFLSQADLLHVKDRLVLYMNNEHDFRGYVQDHGWAHSIAHASDTFEALVRSPKLETLYYEEILQTLLNKVCVHSIYYKYEEDERIVYPIIAMLQNGLKEEVLIVALHDLVAQLPVQKQTLPIKSYEFLYGNIKSFLRSLFFRLRTLSICEETECKIEKLLRELPKYY
ncbi:MULTISPECIES: DUF2785 domain-containing protein [Bacillus]|uniref:DUF2785 domain-containing protein n=1 Tax=Bacillus TaxID=1386 RepID=UPI00032E4172|nr:DUF2785 domain-containing protein [Bacillus wiedmannii]EOP14072.1 hypothetical protein ICS_00904 [Bacillus cereus BAG2O-3]EOQ08842.1 hypothetical protein KQ3_03950 [Bacillus cereus B5-2]MDA1600911.1 DUF2785 domain-containing protein [Bacillus cereus]PFW85909.1 DUF2785 domain-containing protein [Bacillus sp. AFS075960]RFB10832.1 DUF2785 domain-containing protein [Bacillus sp. OE]RFB50652.1 DUF2785 domain-containing protein [Bacillus sp. dmp10]RFB77635.1 DUF2785 domain-containing protein [B